MNKQKTMTQTKIIEINGVKMEIDLRNAKVIEHYKVGDSLKILTKDYGDNYKSHIGVIIGFDDFEKTPTIVIAYLDINYSSAEIKFIYFNGKTKDVEITTLNKWDIPLKKSDILNKFDSEIAKKEQELDEISQKKNVFENLFGKYFELNPMSAGINPADDHSHTSNVNDIF